MTAVMGSLSVSVEEMERLQRNAVVIKLLENYEDFKKICVKWESWNGATVFVCSFS